jgi:2-amino-4-hydroxy-6-hydroxymethyldihydropteridine diphosphokinase
MARVYVGLGGNLGRRVEAIHEACERMVARGAALVTLSPLYETEPWGLVDQPRFINAACAVDVPWAPLKTLQILKGIEREIGRAPAARYGPRVIDLDILLFDRVHLVTHRLTIPHPGMLERATVLVPLADIATDLVHPVTRRTIGAHLRDLGEITGIAPYPPGLPSAS